jgi:Holliday junction DNA helicase RuvA
VYAFIEGILQSSAELVIVEAQGIGYEIHVGERQRRTLPAAGERVRLYTHLNVREDDMSLYGFLSLREREVFRALLSVNGVGPRVALGIVGSEDCEDVLRGIRRGDPKPLLAIKGIGRKTAERVVLELEERSAAWVESIAPVGPAVAVGADGSGPAADAVLALQSLGVVPERAAAAVATVLESGPVPGVEELLRAALRELHPDQRTR